MSWSELERFVTEVEADVALQRALQHCRYPFRLSQASPSPSPSR
jgi:hypothetical protein